MIKMKVLWSDPRSVDLVFTLQTFSLKRYLRLKSKTWLSSWRKQAKKTPKYPVTKRKRKRSDCKIIETGGSKR